MTHQSRAAGALEGSHRLSAGLAGRHDGLDAVDRDRLGVQRRSRGTGGEGSGDNGDRGAHNVSVRMRWRRRAMRVQMQECDEKETQRARFDGRPGSAWPRRGLRDTQSPHTASTSPRRRRAPIRQSSSRAHARSWPSTGGSCGRSGRVRARRGAKRSKSTFASCAAPSRFEPAVRSVLGLGARVGAVRSAARCRRQRCGSRFGST